ncbi:MAG TPA: C40 family peptidase [Dokdonella sp.]
MLISLLLPGPALLAAPLLDLDAGAPDVAAVDAAIASALPATAGDAATAATSTSPGARLRRLLADFAVTLRDIRYRRGGREPATGFDCSGFVRYVFSHTLGQDLPPNSAEQFRAGTKVAREELKTGDLVFFRTHGKRISHVGIYLGGGRFIHSPSSGKRVSISDLDDAYWAKRYVGAKRPNGLS